MAAGYVYALPETRKLHKIGNKAKNPRFLAEKGFPIPVTAGAGISAQNLVRDLEGGYFDKLLITPLDRAVLLLSPILPGAVMLGLQASAVLAVGLLLGLNSATGLAGLVAVVAFSVLLGTGFAGFTVSAALASGSAAVTESATFVFVPLVFIAPTFVPIALLDGWLKTAASLNPITYVLQAMRTLLSTGWDINVMWKGVLACVSRTPLFPHHGNYRGGGSQLALVSQVQRRARTVGYLMIPDIRRMRDRKRRGVSAGFEATMGRGMKKLFAWLGLSQDKQ